MNNFSVNSSAETASKKSFLALDHVFLIAMNIFDASHTQHCMDFYLSTSLLTTALELENAQWERILTQIDKALGDLFKMNIKGVAVSCRADGDALKLSFSDPGYHDLELAAVLIKDGSEQKTQAA
jgi:hypothetical protein